jgi:GNAT superfamily N-acetyltransferase
MADVIVRELDRPGDLGWVVMTHGELYAREYDWDVGFERLVARIVGEYAGGAGVRQGAWLAEVDGERAGCIFCMPSADDGSARLRLLLVDPKHRGLGIGRALVDRCVDFAREAGYARMTLWTNDVLVAARRIYQAAGFELVAEERHHSFGHDLLGQTWELGLDRL